MSKELVLKTETIREEDGIIFLSFLPDSELTLDDLKSTNEAIRETFGRKKHLMCIDTSTVKSITQDFRVYAASKEQQETGAAVALLAKTPVSKVIGNFFITLNKPAYPIKMFLTREDAVVWLKSLPRES